METSLFKCNIEFNISEANNVISEDYDMKMPIIIVKSSNILYKIYY